MAGVIDGYLARLRLELDFDPALAPALQRMWSAICTRLILHYSRTAGAT